MLWFMGLQRVRHDWVTELNWTEFQISRKKAILGREPTYTSQGGVKHHGVCQQLHAFGTEGINCETEDNRIRGKSVNKTGA